MRFRFVPLKLPYFHMRFLYHIRNSCKFLTCVWQHLWSPVLMQVFFPLFLDSLVFLVSLWEGRGGGRGLISKLKSPPFLDDSLSY